MPQKAPMSIMPSSPTLMTPLRSDIIPAIDPKTSGVASPNVCAMSVASKTALRLPVPERVAEDAGRERAPAEAAHAAGDGPDPQQRSDDADEDRPRRPSRHDRRNGQERREAAEDDADDAARRRVAQARADRVVEPLRPGRAHADASATRARRGHIRLRVFQT